MKFILYVACLLATTSAFAAVRITCPNDPARRFEVEVKRFTADHVVVTKLAEENHHSYFKIEAVNPNIDLGALSGVNNPCIVDGTETSNLRETCSFTPPMTHDELIVDHVTNYDGTFLVMKSFPLGMFVPPMHPGQSCTFNSAE
jgi:hypothetical protein